MCDRCSEICRVFRSLDIFVAMKDQTIRKCTSQIRTLILTFHFLFHLSLRKLLLPSLFFYLEFGVQPHAEHWTTFTSTRRAEQELEHEHARKIVRVLHDSKITVHDNIKRGLWIGNIRPTMRTAQHKVENSPIVASTSHVAGYHLLVSKDGSATVFGLISSTRAVFALVD